MNKNTHKRWLLLLWLIPILGIGCAILMMPRYCKVPSGEWVNSISLAGCWLTLVAIIFTFIEAWSINTKASAIDEATQKTKNFFENVTNVINLTECIKKLETAHVQLDNDQLIMAHYILSDVFRSLSYIVDHAQDFNADSAKASRHLYDLTQDLRNLNNNSKSINSIEKSVIKNHIDEISGFLYVICQNSKQNKL